MQFTTSLLTLLTAAAAAASALPGSSSSLDARQTHQIQVQFYSDFCNGTPIGPLQTWFQRSDKNCTDVTASVPAGVGAFAVKQNSATVDVRVYSNNICNENVGPHLDITKGQTGCFFLDSGVKSTKWQV